MNCFWNLSRMITNGGNLAGLFILLLLVHSGNSTRRGRRNRQGHYTTTTTPMTPPMTYNPDSVTQSVNSVIPAEYFTAPLDSNPHNFSYSINNVNICSTHKHVFLLLIVLTSPDHVDRRMAIRDTWAASYNVPNYTIPVAFMLGRTSDFTAQTDINSENGIYADIVQEDFNDSRDNLSLKTIMAFKWAATYCTKAEYVLFATDYVMVDVFKLVEYLQRRHTTPHHFSLCYLQPCCASAQIPMDGHTNMSGMRNYSANNFLRQIDKVGTPIYSGKHFPTHCSGAAYVLPSSGVNQLYRASIHTPIFSPYYIYVGTLAEKLQLNFTDNRIAFIWILQNTNKQLHDRFQHPSFINDQVMVIGLEVIYGSSRVANAMRQLWLTISDHYRNSAYKDWEKIAPKLNGPDNHSDTVVKVAVLINAILMTLLLVILMYRRFCHKVLPFPSNGCYCESSCSVQTCTSKNRNESPT